jgi:hypothetical protein
MTEKRKYDYKVTVASILITGLKRGYGEEKEKTERVKLPLFGGCNNVPYDVDGSELHHALAQSGIEDKTYHFTELCCDEFKLFLKQSDNRQYLRSLAGCMETYNDPVHIFHCPFCGKRIRFEDKVLGTFRIGKEKREVCTQKFEKVG